MSTATVGQTNEISEDEVAAFFGATREEVAEMDRELDRMLAEMRRMSAENQARNKEIARYSAETRANLRQIKQTLGLHQFDLL